MPAPLSWSAVWVHSAAIVTGQWSRTAPAGSEHKHQALLRRLGIAPWLLAASPPSSALMMGDVMWTVSVSMDLVLVTAMAASPGHWLTV